MNIFSYSPSTGGFYRQDMHSTIPADAVNLTQERYEELMDKLAQGHIIVVNENGQPLAVAAELSASPVPLPDLTARQFWQAALVLGITEEGLVASISDPQDALYVQDEAERVSAIIDIRKATSFRRDYPLVDEMAAAHNITTEQMDDLWAWAAAIE